MGNMKGYDCVGGSTRALVRQSSSSSLSKSKKKTSKPAFDGAAFDKDGNCIKHKSVQLAEQVTQDGRVLWKEIKMVSARYDMYMMCIRCA